MSINISHILDTCVNVPPAIRRAGVIPYTFVNNQIMFCFGVDIPSGDLTDFGGGRRRNESILTCANREFMEESLGVFGNYRIYTRKHDYPIIYSPTMMIVLIPVFPYTEYWNLIFKHTLKQICPDTRIEVSDLVWVHWDQMMEYIMGNNNNIIYKNKSYIIYNVVKNFLQGLMEAHPSFNQHLSQLYLQVFNILI